MLCDPPAGSHFEDVRPNRGTRGARFARPQPPEALVDIEVARRSMSVHAKSYEGCRTHRGVMWTHSKREAEGPAWWVNGGHGWG